VDDGGVAGVTSWAAEVAAPAKRAMVQSVAESIWKLECVFEYVLECGNVIPCVLRNSSCVRWLSCRKSLLNNIRRVRSSAVAELPASKVRSVNVVGIA
jgi:hypothetical protein